MRISDWSSDVCSSDLGPVERTPGPSDVVRHLLAVLWTQDVGADGGGRRRVEPPDHVEATDNEHQDGDRHDGGASRSEERRVGKEWVSTWRSRWSALH